MFSQHPKSEFWSDRNVKKPYEVALNSHKKFWFDCQCGHQFENSLLHINQENRWCPYCAHQKLCDNEDCKMCFQNSFASHEKAIYWSKENEVLPRNVFKSKPVTKFAFDCDICKHSFYINLNKISSLNRWCHYCSHQKLCDNDDCEFCFKKSFASVEKSKFISDKTIDPRKIFKRTNKKLNFDCDVCNKVFESQLSNVTNGSWCPYCVNKTEKIFFDKLKEVYPSLIAQFKVEWCKNKKNLPFDFVLEDKKIIIELDGKQHFEQISNWFSPEETRKNDLYKMKCANENGFSVIRILQNDVYYNKYDWLIELIANVEKIYDEKAVQNIYMCKKDEYKDFDI
jgi:very-short-patch-repair endonuclease